MHEKCPTPATLTICTPGVNHSMQFASVARAKEEYQKLAEAMDAMNELLSKGGTDSRGLHSITDDYGASVELRVEQIASLRITDLVSEHMAAQNIELTKFYVALDFQERADRDHPALKVLRAKAPPQNIIRPQGH